MTEEYEGFTIMVNHGYFEVGTYGRYTHRGEILHQFDSFSHGNSEKEVLENIKRYIDKRISDANHENN